MIMSPGDLKDWRLWLLSGSSWVAGAGVFLLDAYQPDAQDGLVTHGAYALAGLAVMAGLAPAIVSFGLVPLMFIAMLIDATGFIWCKILGRKYED